jgi:hypothetical protein
MSVWERQKMWHWDVVVQTWRGRGLERIHVGMVEMTAQIVDEDFVHNMERQ